MELGQLFVIIAVVLLLLVLILFPEARKLLMGWTRVFIKDMATTPEGAQAIYAEKINEAQDRYNVADNALRQAAGRLHNEERKLETMLASLAEVEKQCEALVKAGKMDVAAIKSEQRADLMSDIERCKKIITAYKEAKSNAQEAHKACDMALRKLKKEAKEVVENMRVKAQLNEVYDSMDELKSATATDKLLDSIKEKNEDLNASVAGARVIHESRTSTKVQRADEQARKIQGDDYLESLKKKYSK